MDEMIFTSTRPNVGDPLRFRPSAFSQFDGKAAARNAVNGRVVCISGERRYYTAEGMCNGYVIRESWKF